MNTNKKQQRNHSSVLKRKSNNVVREVICSTLNTLCLFLNFADAKADPGSHPTPLSSKHRQIEYNPQHCDE